MQDLKLSFTAGAVKVLYRNLLFSRPATKAQACLRQCEARTVC